MRAGVGRCELSATGELSARGLDGLGNRCVSRALPRCGQSGSGTQCQGRLLGIAPEKGGWFGKMNLAVQAREAKWRGPVEVQGLRCIGLMWPQPGKTDQQDWKEQSVEFMSRWR